MRKSGWCSLPKGIECNENLYLKVQASPRLRFLLSALLAIMYAVTGSLALELHSVARIAAPIWPPAGIALAALLIFGTSLWPGILIGSMVADYLATKIFLLSFTIAVGSTCEILAAVLLLRSVQFNSHYALRQPDLS